MTVTAVEIARAIADSGLSNRCVCLHSSLRPFGYVDGGAGAVVGAFLDQGCTLLVPAFSFEAFAAPPPADGRPLRNGTNYSGWPETSGRVYQPALNDIDGEMGAIPRAVVTTAGRVRGNHPLCSFAAIGPLAAELVRGQAPHDVFAPLRALAESEGFVVLAGVGMTSMTLLHAAEQSACRQMFVRWASGVGGGVEPVEVGGCSEGFGRLGPILSGVARTTRVGESEWLFYPAALALALATAAIRADPSITHCRREGCTRCDDAVAGGPIVVR
jgi:aminoglycoside 3-N-acetyltransferase